jgi:CBS domain-containing protein
MSEGSKEKLGDYMKSPVTCIDSKENVQKAAKLMEDEGVSAILIKVNGEFTGIVTERDFTRKIVASGLALDTPISEIMNVPIYTMDKNQHILQGIEFMTDNNTRHLTITDNGEIVGIITVKDSFSYYMRVFGLEE